MEINSSVTLKKELFAYEGEKIENPKYYIKKIKDNSLVEGRSSSGIDVLKTSLFYKYEVDSVLYSISIMKNRVSP